jgi:Big-like domain-containing protein
MRISRLYLICASLVTTLLLSSVAAPVTPAHAATTVTVNATQRYQVVQGLGVNINVHSWNNGELKPILDQLTDELGATAFRVVIDNADWESTNDDTDPNHFNWDYYRAIYESTKFTDLWNTIAYLNSKHVTVSVSVMGPLAQWMGGSSLATSQEPEWVEMMASLVYYGRVNKGLSFTLFEPFNEPDWNGIEGTQATAAQVVRVMHSLAVRLESLGLGDVKFILPDTADLGAGLGTYFSAMQGDSYLMGKVAALGLHNYGGSTGGAVGIIAGSTYPSLPFWMTEFSAWCSGCDTGAPNPSDWSFASTTARYMMNNLGENAAGAEVWEGYDSYYEHHSSWSYWGLLAYDTARGSYSPRKSFYAMTQFMRFIPPGSVRIAASSGNSSLPLLAFHDQSSGRVTLVGFNTSSATETVSGTLMGIDGLTAMAYYRTNATANMESVGDVPVTAGQFSITVPGDTLFTLSGVAGPDTTPPTVSLTYPTSGATVAGLTQLAASASDNRGVARVEFNVDGAVVGTISKAPYQLAWDARTVDTGTHTITARAVDAAGNSTSSSADVTVIRDTTPPSIPTGLSASAPSAGEVDLNWQPSADNIAVAGYTVRRDGTVIGTAATTTYVDTTVTPGSTYSYSVEARDTSDNLSPASAPLMVTVDSQAGLAVDTMVTTHQTTASATIISPTFSTTKAGDLLVAFAGSDGSTDSAQSYSSVTGGGLTWQLRQRANAQAGTAEIWTAVAPAPLTNVQVTATRARGSYLGSLTVVAFSGADLVTNGATAGQSAATGTPSVQLTTTRANAWVWAVGHDWDRAIARTVPADQELVDQYLASVGDTFWVQRLKAPTPNAGTLVTVNATAPTTDRWNFAAIEIVPRSSTR